MHITIDIWDIIRYGLLSANVLMGIGIVVLHIKKRRAEKELASTWSAAHPMSRMAFRGNNLIADALVRHQERYKDDLLCGAAMIKSRDGENSFFFHQGGAQNVRNWHEGAGLEVARLFASACATVERERPGLLAVLLDEERDKIRAEEAKRVSE